MKRIYQNPTEIKEVLLPNTEFALVSGCFDLLHAGHVRLLETCSGYAPLLVVGVLSDRYIQLYKGTSRPIINERQRAFIVSSLRFVDFVFIADMSPNSVESLSALRPHHIIFEHEIVVSEKTRRRLEIISRYSPETKTHFLPRFDEEGVDTTSII